ncbi:MAG TPA: HAD hydrolase-like protein, partial [Chloroflexota bacterium]|nr:HAD hydrolase-like protein [Chloroflexota bacterium]
MGLLTGNISDIAWGRVDECGLRSYFVSGAFGDEAMRRSTLVRRAIRRCGQSMSTTIDPTQVIVVGDTPRDVRAAHLAGARAVAVATGEFTAEELQRQRPLAVLQDLTDTDSITRLLTSCQPK